jgi:hypothetical protein
MKLFLTSVDQNFLYSEERIDYINGRNYNRVKANKERVLQVSQVLEAVPMNLFASLDGLVMLELSFE